MITNKKFWLSVLVYFGWFILFNVPWILGFLLSYAVINTIYLDITYPENVPPFILGGIAIGGMLLMFGSLRIFILFFQEKLHYGLFSDRRLEWAVSKWMKQYQEFGPTTKGLAITSFIDMMDRIPEK